MVTGVPGTPLDGVTAKIVAVLTLKGTALDHDAPCRTRADPDMALDATVATICVSLQLATAPRALPSQTAPVGRRPPRPHLHAPDVGAGATEEGGVPDCLTS
jgi:hypothetical protein